ncbi:MAG TPA: glycosyltransferase family 4 protein [Dyadobacter sp.]|nr:glycosyltransferase family 4 protein [Dyadobacter sp.]
MKNVTLLRISTETYSLRILLRNQLAYMGSKGINVVMASYPDQHVKELEQQEKASFYPLPLTRELTPFADAIALFHTVRLIRKIKPDIVHTHSPKAGIIGMLAAAICRVPVKIHTVAGLPLMEVTGPKRWLLNFVEKVVYGCADWVLPNSNQLRDFIIDSKLITDQRKITVIGKGSSNGVDMNYFTVTDELKQEIDSFKQEKGITQEHTVLGFVGRLAFYKGINELIGAFEKIQAQKSNLKLLLIGAYEDLNPLEETTLEKIRTNPDIIAVGHQKDIRKFLAAIDIFVFPSYREGFPQALMQASAIGLPSIATNINGCNEIIEDNQTGILIEPKNEGAIVEACVKLLNDADLRVEMGRKARKNISENYEQRKLWNNIYDFYQSQLN